MKTNNLVANKMGVCISLKNLGYGRYVGGIFNIPNCGLYNAKIM